VQTTAVRDGDTWVVSGQKVWSSGARHATLGECLVRTSSDGPKHAGLTMLLVDMTSPGIDVRPIHQMTGGSEFYEVFLDDVTVPGWMILGGLGEGWAATTDTLANERAAIGEQILPAAWLQRRLLDAVASRGAAGDPVVRQLAVDAVMRLILAGRLPTHLASTKPPPAAVALLKLAASATVERVASAAAVALGPAMVADSGEPDTYAWSELVLGLPGLRIGGGTDEVLKTMIAERVLGLPREPA
jgi:alkylation response protein AidB-like acyl-CoA dehydrogenase